MPQKSGDIREELEQITRAPQKQKKRTVCVIGHKNPDTDSICAAISYTYLKKQLEKPDGRYQYVACRAGSVSAETQFVLDYFHVPQPLFIENIGTRVKDLEIRRTPGVDAKISVKDAWNLMNTQNVFTLPITDAESHLQGLITINDIAKSYMDENDSAIVSVARTPYRNIMETLDAEMVVGDPEASFTEGKVVIAAANPDVMENYINPHDMVILGNRYESQLMSILAGAGCIVVCLGAPVSKTIQHMAKEKGTTILVTPLDTYTVARLINQSMPIDFFMKSDNLITFHLGDFTDQIKEIMSKKRYRDFPVLDKRGAYIGTISRRNLLNARKRALILVDHNEVSQAVDNVENAEILEILDHHKIGTLQTINPVFFRNQPVGSTSTIVYEMYRENNVEIPKTIAGLLASAILSDTLIFRSPTCTMMDRMAAEHLAKIAGIEPEEYARKMFRAGSDLKNRTPEEIFYTDFKTFEVNEETIGIGQITSMDEEELSDIRDRIKPFIEKAYEQHGLSLAFFMLTNIIDESTTMICYGKHAQELLESAFGVTVEDHIAKMPGIVSRKKQVVPVIMAELNKDNDV
ncbi:MAG: putative manganese-dependent inorganic diphosphatase [Porcincola intestinalis]|uniref:inorganic diphosphatase n=1 Tax=Porcincola intestinalis TaxID=2606632 RepID=A0A6L5X614_9FIRM|nr:putative manganese-dependent inorganic diphosphatase [Porcincola intestinalis]MCI6238928.1 putative manganese-dependent inorganic diphosphatase [Lachnospiraceae bacterium]MCI6698345.1 putative manganese-dependent inorganic diphosphatase [Lachnospiraceae bacterium]MCI7092757.1 putative manganese-dependent inorganic diphosphatase [Lachnospiraceae bacterium]MDY5333087.1 putative manganese-dependent inorganic diphosphatase [Porcincola intestinalis]MSS15809.1 putative manganese-dependent inorgan